jgi:hypothetical protein
MCLNDVIFIEKNTLFLCEHSLLFNTLKQELQREDNVEENVLILSRKKTRARPRNDRGVGDTEKRSCRLPDGAATSNKEATLYEELLLFLLSSLLDASRKPKRIPKLPLSIPLQKIQFGMRFLNINRVVFDVAQEPPKLMNLWESTRIRNSLVEELRPCLMKMFGSH